MNFHSAGVAGLDWQACLTITRAHHIADDFAIALLRVGEASLMKKIAEN